MNCLCCNQSFDKFSLKEHYVTCHNVDENNYFFRKLFMREKFFVPGKCFRCDYSCLNRRDKNNHDFLIHYKMGGRQLIEDKPLKKTFFDENLQRYCINFSELGDYCTFMTHENLFLIF